MFQVVETVVENLEEPGRYEQYLAYLGGLHEQLGIARGHLDVMGPVFCQTIRPVLQAEAQWDNQVRETWMHLFRYETYPKE